MLDKQLIKEYLDYYKKIGFSPIPVKYKTKRINLSCCDLTQKITDKQIQKWYQKGLYENIGLLVGKPSNNLAVIDIDRSDISINFLKEQITYNNQIIGYLSKTNRGFQIWINNNDIIHSNQTTPDLKLELFSEKHIIVVPPSIHPLGTQYTFLYKPDYFRKTNVSNIYTHIKVYFIERNPDEILKSIMNPLKKDQIIKHLENPNCEHNSRLWIVGFLYTVLLFDKKQILDFIEIQNKWEDYNPEKTEKNVTKLLEYIDKKVGEKGGLS